MIMKGTYYDNTGKHQKELDRLTEQLIPAWGQCETLGGELIRCVQRLGYDFYNNGFCNNTSGAINFIYQKGAIDIHTYEVVYPFTCGQEVYEGRYNGDAIHLAVEAIINQTVEYILDNPEIEGEHNGEDSFDFEDEYFQLDDEDDFGW